MRKLSPRVLLILALTLSIICGMMIYSFLSKNDKSDADKTAVVVAAMDIAPGTQMTAEMLRLELIPNELVQQGAIRKVNDAVGKRLKMPANTGDQITQKRLNAAGTMGSFIGTIPNDKRAVTITVDDVSGVAGFIAPGSYVVEKLLYRQRQVFALLKQHIELGLAGSHMLRSGIGALHLLSHVIYLESEYRQTVYCPSRTLCVDFCVGKRLDIGIFSSEITINFLNKVGAVLVRLVDTAFQGKSLHRVYFWVAYQVLKMPLHRVNPVFDKQVVLYGAVGIGVAHSGIYIVGHMIESYRLVKNFVTVIYETHEYHKFIFLTAKLVQNFRRTPFVAAHKPCAASFFDAL